MSRRDTIWKWVFYTAGVLLLLLLQGLALDHISLLHVHPYLPPVMVAVLAMFEGAYGGMGVALAMGLLFDLTQPGLIPCFHILAFLLAALAGQKGRLAAGRVCAVLALCLAGLYAVIAAASLRHVQADWSRPQGVPADAALAFCLCLGPVCMAFVTAEEETPRISPGTAAASALLPADHRSSCPFPNYTI